MKNRILAARHLIAPVACVALVGCFESAPRVETPFEETTDTPMAPIARGGAIEYIDFQALPAGTIVDELYGDLGSGPILVHGTNPDYLPEDNYAVIFDSANPTGGDWDLGTPNETCDPPGPGQGVGGEVGSPYENCEPLYNVLIIAEDLVDGDGDGLVDDPDDTDHTAIDGAVFSFDFSQLGGVTLFDLTALDMDGNAPDARVELYGEGDVLLNTVPLPAVMENNGVETVDLGPTADVYTMLVHIQGSGAIDDLRFMIEEEGGGQGCTPGYWKQRHHFCHWADPYEIHTTFESVFGREVPGVITLLDGLHSNGSYQNLVFHAVAALLNAASDNVEYDYSEAEVISMFQDAWDSGDYGPVKGMLEDANEAGCPLGNCRGN